MPQRFGSVLLATLGLLAVVIAAVGIYATLAHTVAQRTNELGITTIDATAFVGATVVLAFVVGAAGLIPACRTCRVDPIRALRQE